MASGGDEVAPSAWTRCTSEIVTSKTSPMTGEDASQDDRLSQPSMLPSRLAYLQSILHSAASRQYASRDQKRDQQTTSTSRLLALPAELRELIWIHTVTEWMPAHEIRKASPTGRIHILEKRPIRMDRLNRPLPPAITRVSRQIQLETLPLYYQENIFECWRPLFWKCDWSLSTLIDWLNSLHPQEVSWLRHIVLMYKSKDELEYDVEVALLEQGYELEKCTITNQCELSEYEQCFEELGLPRHFGKKRRNDRYGASRNNAS